MFGKRNAKPGIGAGGENPARIYQRGLSAFETGRYLEAIEMLSTIAETNSLPGTLARFYLGQAHMRQGHIELAARRYEEAARHFMEARRINPDSVGLSRYLTTCHAARGRFDMAAAELEKSAAQSKHEPSLPIRLAYAYFRDGQRERAVQTLADAIGSAPKRADLHYHLGLIHASADEYEYAAESLAEAARLSPFDAAIHRQLGLAYGALQRMDDAVRHLEKAKRLAPHDAYVAQLLAMALAAAGERTKERMIDGGIAAARLAESSRPWRPEGRGSSEESSVMPVSDDLEAIDALGRIIALEPEFVEAFLSLPESQVDHEIFALLAGTLERALERQPDFADLHYHCSRVYHRLGRTDDAIERADHAIRLNPRYVLALIQLGRLYAHTDRGDEAIARLRDAIAHGGDYPDVHYLIGELHRKVGDRVAARDAFQRALELNDKFERAREALETVAAE